MTALVGCVLSYALLVSASSGTEAPTQGELCAAAVDIIGLVDAVGACPLDGQAPLQAAAAAGATNTYSNPLEVNCPATLGNGSVALVNQGDKSDWFRGCDGRSFDFRYRVSRFPDSERQSGALGPQRDRRNTRSVTLATGAPPRGGTLVSAASPPVALYAVVRLAPLLEASIVLPSQRRAPTRVLEPLERPPRA